MHKVDSLSEKLSLGRLRAVRLRPYYATAIYRLIPVLTDQIATVAVDRWWRLYYNAQFVDGVDMLELATSILHEIEHLLRKHHGRCETNGFQPEVFNIAGDCEINDDIMAQPELKLIKGAVYPSRFNLPNNLTAEQYYASLENQVTFVEVDCGSGAHGRQRPSELGPPSADKRGIGEEEGELVRGKVADDVLKWAAKNPGNVPAGILRWAQAIRQPKVPWQRVLRGAIRVNFAKAAGMTDFTFDHPHRRQSLYPDFIMPALYEPVPNAAVIVDTSGSMEEAQLEQALAEIRGVMRSLGMSEGIHVLSVDCAVHSVKRVMSPKKINLLGGGGTDMGAGLAQAAKLRPKPDFCIVITDGFTPWPDAPPPGMKPIVVLVGGGKAPSWARTIYAVAV